MKRKDALNWEDYFMSLAFLAAKRSKDPVTQVGACIVNEDNIVVGLGYNGFPVGCSDDAFPWGNDSPNPLQRKKLFVCHAELNAILNKNCANAKNCRIYVALFPCSECAKCIIQSGIKEVVYLSDKKASRDTTAAAKMMFDAAGVEYRQHIPERKEVIIDFSVIEPSLYHCE